MLPSDVPIAETLAFLRAQLRTPPARILEVGCGDGDLAARIQELGYQVVAVDCSDTAVAKARGRGVDATVASWPDFADGLFDALLFTRSLHHIHPLPRAVARAKEMLHPHGLVLVEDFAAYEIDALSAQWVYQALALLDAGGHLRRNADTFAEKVLRAEGAISLWHAAHEHGLHTAAAMDTCLRDYFAEVCPSKAPYLYRYMCTLLEESQLGFELARRVLHLEMRFVETANLTFLGRRWFCRNT
ncbi:MAG: class I SAM-dependent methyltransferase [Planctomycetes bacterium]|nr:class I SAM-dependent methyltransferase [Planctomycetota bacterium]